MRERERERSEPLSLTYSDKVLQSEHKASPVKPRFSHSLELSCSDEAPKNRDNTTATTTATTFFISLRSACVVNVRSFSFHARSLVSVIWAALVSMDIRL